MLFTTVADTGLGMSQREVKKLVTDSPAFKVDEFNETNASDIFSTGFRNSKALVEYLGGAIKVKSMVNEGT
jgi:hypothetical protein